MTANIRRIDEFESFVEENAGTVVYFSTPECNVCKVLKPKLISMLEENYPRMKFAYVDISEARELAGQQRIFTVPTILFFFEGKEFLRKSRNINFAELNGELSRIYSIVFGD